MMKTVSKYRSRTRIGPDSNISVNKMHIKTSASFAEKYHRQGKSHRSFAPELPLGVHPQINA